MVYSCLCCIHQAILLVYASRGLPYCGRHARDSEERRLAGQLCGICKAVRPWMRTVIQEGVSR
jgi:hypothetical protein